jgi:hypothetical protein
VAQLRCIVVLLLTLGTAYGENKSGCNHFYAPVSVLSQKQPSAQPDPGQLEATIDGKPAHVSGWDPIAAHRFIIVVDASGSMKAGGTRRQPAPVWQLNLELARHFAGSLTTGSATGLVIFNRVIQRRVTPRSPTEILAVLNEAQADRALPNGRTALFDAIEVALEMLEPTQPGDTIYVLSDAEDNESRIGPSQFLKTIRSSGVRLFGVLAGAEEPVLGTRQSERRDSLLQAVHDSGGDIFKGKFDGATLPGELKNTLYAEMGNTYSLRLESSQPVSKGRLRIRLRDPAAAEYTVLHPYRARPTCGARP